MRRFIYKNILPPTLQIAILLNYIYRKLTRNIYVIFFELLIIYFFSDFFFERKALSFNELMTWIATQDETTKTSILSTIITVVGFLVAYMAATANWKGQLFTSFKIQVSDEIELLFNEAGKLITECEIYAKFLIETIEKFKSNCREDSAIFLLNYNKKKHDIFIENINKLNHLLQEAYRLKGKYFGIFSITFNATRNLDISIQSLNDILDSLYINTPNKYDDNFSVSDQINFFIEDTDIPGLNKFLQISELRHIKFSLSSGELRNTMLSSLHEPNIWLLLNMYKERKDIAVYFTEVLNINDKDNRLKDKKV